MCMLILFRKSQYGHNRLTHLSISKSIATTSGSTEWHWKTPISRSPFMKTSQMSDFFRLRVHLIIHRWSGKHPTWSKRLDEESDRSARETTQQLRKIQDLTTDWMTKHKSLLVTDHSHHQEPQKNLHASGHGGPLCYDCLGHVFGVSSRSTQWNELTKTICDTRTRGRSSGWLSDRLQFVNWILGPCEVEDGGFPASSKTRLVKYHTTTSYKNMFIRTPSLFYVFIFLSFSYFIEQWKYVRDRESGEHI